MRKPGNQRRHGERDRSATVRIQLREATFELAHARRPPIVDGERHGGWTEWDVVGLDVPLATTQ
jgi:hypothetical protein